MNKIFIVGIDPGKSGGIVALTNGKVTDISRMPQTPIDLVNHFIYLGFPNQPIGVKSYVIIENVHSMPTDGSRAAFSFGRQLGQLEGSLASFGINAIKVTPQIWQAYYGLHREKSETSYWYKKRIRDKARIIAKSDKLSLETCDAYLIALWSYKNITQLIKE